MTRNNFDLALVKNTTDAGVIAPSSLFGNVRPLSNDEDMIKSSHIDAEFITAAVMLSTIFNWPVHERWTKRESPLLS